MLWPTDRWQHSPCVTGQLHPAYGRCAVIEHEGVPRSRFFDFYADVMFSVSKPVDIIDLSVKSLFTDMVRREGKAISGHR